MEQKMFCYQCQETAGCRGCTQSGVCGKTPDVAAMQDLLVYVSRGVVPAVHSMHRVVKQPGNRFAILRPVFPELHVFFFPLPVLWRFPVSAPLFLL